MLHALPDTGNVLRALSGESFVQLLCGLICPEYPDAVFVHDFLYCLVYPVILPKLCDVLKFAFETGIVLYELCLDRMGELPVVPLPGEVFLEILPLFGEKRVAVAVEAGEDDI